MLQKIQDIPRRVRNLIACLLLEILGRDRFYIFAQKKGFFPSLCKNFSMDPHLRKIVLGFIEIETDGPSERRSATSLMQYADESLGGFGDYDFVSQGDTHNPLSEQLRSVVVLTVEQAIKSINGNVKVCEIGSGNGDVSALLASRHPNTNFIGIDVNTDNAGKKHNMQNLNFIRGYALDLLESGALNDVDIIFASSTFVVFTPLELENYFKAMKASRIKKLIVSEPLTRKYDPRSHPAPKSIHMAKGMWGHNYAHYAEDIGFDTFKDDRVLYAKHSKRAIINMHLFGCNII
jgi:hypothetical protein